MRQDLAWWLHDQNLIIGVPLHTPPPECLLSSDTLNKGWGVHLEDLLTSGVWDQQDKELHINVLELKAAFLALQEFQKRVTGHSVVLMSDNTTVVAYINKRGTSLLSTSRIDSTVHQWTVIHSAVLSARYIPGKRNVVADELSCQGQVLGTERSLHLEVAERLFHLWES